ncbi:hypothetical protein ACFLQ0_02200 [Nitrospinota bacterium]
MFLYRFGRFLQVLALIDCAFALFFAGVLPEFGGMDAQFQVLLLAGALFLSGRFFQKKGEDVLRSKGVIPPRSGSRADGSEGRASLAAGGGPESR